MNKSIINNKQTILFVGDSITDCDRSATGGNSLGWGYVRMFSDILTIRDADKEIRVINKGVHGNSIRHLLSRWCDDVIEYNPDILCILIGINDAIRHIDSSTSAHTSPEDFKRVYSQLIMETRNRLPFCTIILLEPFFISKGDNIPGSYRNELIGKLRDYRKVVKDTATEYCLTMIPLSKIFEELLQHKKSAIFSEDKIHPNSTGHLAIAETIYTCLKRGH